jgi:hypothetical protein
MDARGKCALRHCLDEGIAAADEDMSRRPWQTAHKLGDHIRADAAPEVLRSPWPIAG